MYLKKIKANAKIQEVAILTLVFLMQEEKKPFLSEKI